MGNTESHNLDEQLDKYYEKFQTLQQFVIENGKPLSINRYSSFVKDSFEELLLKSYSVKIIGRIKYPKTTSYITTYKNQEYIFITIPFKNI